MAPPPPPPAGAAPLVVTAVIPLKAVARAKTRLAPALSPEDRALLLHRTFDRVATAVLDAPSIAAVLVVAGCEVGAGWAAARGLPVLRQPEGVDSLNGALAAVDDALGDRPTLVLPADLPLVGADDLDVVVASLPPGGGVVVAATADGGTGALLRVPGRVIAPSFGPGSATTHLAAAADAAVPFARVHVAGLALDLDRPADLEQAGGWSALTAPRTLPD